MEYTKEQVEAFDHAMEQEKYWAACEYASVARNDYSEADHAHRMRWRMMDAAIRVLEQDRGRSTEEL